MRGSGGQSLTRNCDLPRLPAAEVGLLWGDRPRPVSLEGSCIIETLDPYRESVGGRETRARVWMRTMKVPHGERCKVSEICGEGEYKSQSVTVSTH